MTVSMTSIHVNVLLHDSVHVRIHSKFFKSEMDIELISMDFFNLLLILVIFRLGTRASYALILFFALELSRSRSEPSLPCSFVLFFALKFGSPSFLALILSCSHSIRTPASLSLYIYMYMYIYIYIYSKEKEESQNRTARPEQESWDSKNGESRKGQAEQDCDKTARTGPPGQDCQDRTVRTGLPGQPARTGLSGQGCQQRTARIK